MEIDDTENAREFSSAVKGETLEDTIRVLCEYGTDAIVLRHHETGAAERAAAVSSCPIINAGDGTGQHPTQALLDVYTIYRYFPEFPKDFTVLIGGDLRRGRTARSLAYLLPKFTTVKFVFVAPEELRMGLDILNHLRSHNIQYIESENLQDVISEAHAIYWTRTQTERPEKDINIVTDEVAAQYCITSAILDKAKPNIILMHPLPKNSEISLSLDCDPRAVYFKQAGNGIPIRMALLEYVLL